MGRRRRSGDAEIVALVVMLSVGLVVGVFKLLAHLFEAASSRKNETRGGGPSARSQAFAAITAIGLLIALVAFGAHHVESERDRGSTTTYVESSAPPAPIARPGVEALERARTCLNRDDWDCVEAQVQAAARAGESTTAIAAEASVELHAAADQLVKDAKKASRTDRRRLLADAESVLARALRLDATNAQAKTSLAAVRKLRRGPSKAKQTAPVRETPAVEASADAVPTTADVTYDTSLNERRDTSDSAPSCAENGSCYGDISATTGRAKTTHVNGYYRKDGTYVRGHYRSR